MFRVKTHIAFIINFWKEYMHGFFVIAAAFLLDSLFNCMNNRFALR